MTRGNQRDTDRAKAQKKAAASKSKNTLSGTEFQRAKEDAAAIMREKQRKADEKRAAEAAAGKKK
ncbi:Putative 4f5 domain protein [Penicillium brasilianum]|uniref:Putative 4f5 domain protein n=1 Tax=Penicillium brasilianum TaxID=104259 RepID=A0A0F7U0D7_PENBI|nr:Putative 4f5 domain protein [Penicillium brasilianum]